MESKTKLRHSLDSHNNQKRQKSKIKNPKSAEKATDGKQTKTLSTCRLLINRRQTAILPDFDAPKRRHSIHCFYRLFKIRSLLLQLYGRNFICFSKSTDYFACFLVYLVQQSYYNSPVRRLPVLGIICFFTYKLFILLQKLNTTKCMCVLCVLFLVSGCFVVKFGGKDSRAQTTRTKLCVNQPSPRCATLGVVSSDTTKSHSSFEAISLHQQQTLESFLHEKFPHCFHTWCFSCDAIVHQEQIHDG